MTADSETLALLKLLELGEQDVAAGRTKPARDAVKRLRRRVEEGKAGFPRSRE